MDGEKKLIDTLLKERLVTQAQLKTALEYRKSIGGTLRDILIKLGFVKEGAIDTLLAEESHMNMIDLVAREIDMEAMAKIPRDLVERHQVLPLKHHHGRSAILLAMGEPTNFAAVEEIQFLTNRQVETALAGKAAIRKALNQYFNLMASDDTRGGKDRDPVEGASAHALALALVKLLVEKKVITRDEVIGQLK